MYFNCLDGSQFNLWRFQTHSKTLEQLIYDLYFANNAALAAHTERILQCISSCFTEATQLFGLEFSLKSSTPLSCTSGRVLCSSWRESIGSTTWGAQSCQMPRSTRKLIIDYVNVCGTTNAWRSTQGSVCLEPSSLLPFYMALISTTAVGTLPILL